MHNAILIIISLFLKMGWALVHYAGHLLKLMYCFPACGANRRPVRRGLSMRMQIKCIIRSCQCRKCQAIEKSLIILYCVIIHMEAFAMYLHRCIYSPGAIPVRINFSKVFLPKRENWQQLQTNLNNILSWMKLQYTMEAINRLLRGCSSRNERELVCSDASRHRSIAHHRTSSRHCNRTTTSSALAHRASLGRTLLWWDCNCMHIASWPDCINNFVMTSIRTSIVVSSIQSARLASLLSMVEECSFTIT